MPNASVDNGIVRIITPSQVCALGESSSEMRFAMVRLDEDALGKLQALRKTIAPDPSEATGSDDESPPGKSPTGPERRRNPDTRLKATSSNGSLPPILAKFIARSTAGLGFQVRAQKILQEVLSGLLGSDPTLVRAQERFFTALEHELVAQLGSSTGRKVCGVYAQGLSAKFESDPGFFGLGHSLARPAREFSDRWAAANDSMPADQLSKVLRETQQPPPRPDAKVSSVDAPKEIADVAERPAQRAAPTSTPSAMLPPDGRTILTALETTDARHNFQEVLTALERTFSRLHSGPTRMSAGIVLEAIENHFAVIVTKTARSAALRSAPVTATFDQLVTLPTTRGLIYHRERAKIVAWSMSKEECHVVAVERADLRTYLLTGEVPRFVTEKIRAGHGESEGPEMRELAGVAIAIQRDDSEFLPLRLSRHGETMGTWSETHLRRMRRQSPHKVREHLRRLESGRVTTVREYTKNGYLDWADGKIRLHFL